MGGHTRMMTSEMTWKRVDVEKSLWWVKSYGNRCGSWKGNQRGSWSVTCPRIQLWAPGIKLRMYHKRAASCRMTASSVTNHILSYGKVGREQKSLWMNKWEGRGSKRRWQIQGWERVPRRRWWWHWDAWGRTSTWSVCGGRQQRRCRQWQRCSQVWSTAQRAPASPAALGQRAATAPWRAMCTLRSQQVRWFAGGRVIPWVSVGVCYVLGQQTVRRLAVTSWSNCSRRDVGASSSSTPTISFSFFHALLIVFEGIALEKKNCFNHSNFPIVFFSSPFLFHFMRDFIVPLHISHLRWSKPWFK